MLCFYLKLSSAMQPQHTHRHPTGEQYHGALMCDAFRNKFPNSLSGVISVVSRLTSPKFEHVLLSRSSICFICRLQRMLTIFPQNNSCSQIYLKEILRDIGIYNVKGTHKNTWELKPEYRHYQGEEKVDE